jgi:hypothetical protein
MVKPISVSALPNWRIKVAFSDGAEGSVDLSELRRQGVFRAWEDEKFFAEVPHRPRQAVPME